MALKLLLDLGGLWLIVFVVILLNGRFGIMGWLATGLGRAVRWQPLGKRVAIQIAEWDSRQVPAPLLWSGSITDLVTRTNPHTQRERACALVVLEPPVSWGDRQVDRVLLIPRHRGYEIDALPVTGIGVNIYSTEPHSSQTVTGFMMTTGWLRLRRFGTAPAE